MKGLAQLWRELRYRPAGLGGLDLKLRQHLPLDGGFFIEAGANDGKTQSNTYLFEKRWGWRGLLVEPLPHLAELCRISRSRSIVEQVALVPFDFAGSEIEMRDVNLMSLVKGAMKSEAEELAHVHAGEAVQHLRSRELRVPVATLESLLVKHRVGQIDLLSLDVEGFELSVLRGLDLEKRLPANLLIEARYREEIDRYLAPLYQPVAELSHHDVLYQPRRAR